jgi:DNA modification methylase
MPCKGRKDGGRSKAVAMNPVGYLETGVVQCAENLEALSEMPDECIDLVYLDPPFFSNRIYEVIWGDEAEVRSFEDRWEGGINVYLEWMEARLRQLHRLLKPTGGLYLHCDQAAGHYLKVSLDQIFGGRNFRNEVVWKRTAAKGDAKRKFPSIHDTILGYTRSRDAYFEPVRRPPDEQYTARFSYNDHDGRGQYRIAPLDSPNLRPNLKYDYKGHPPPKKGWRVSRAVMEELDADGRLAFPTKKSGRIGRKHYLEEQDWPIVGDVWTDIPPLQAASAERLGYPTQKPEALLQRLVQSACPPNGIVLDPFCGCGTTIAVAEKLGRQWIGLDVSRQAIEIMKLRMRKLGVEPTIIGISASIEDLRQLGPFEFQHWVIQRVFGNQSPRKVADMGIDGYSFLENAPIQVKQSERVGRPEIDKFETAVERDGDDRGYMVAFSFTKGAYEEAARAKRERGLSIVLVTVEDVLNVGELIDSADRAGRQPDFSSVTRDLMGLFSAAEKSVADRPFYPAPRKESKPSARDLIASARRKREAEPV